MPPPYAGFGRAPYPSMNSYDRQISQPQQQQQQQQLQQQYHSRAPQQLAYAPPAPLLTNRHYQQPMPHPYYTVHSAPYQVYSGAPSPIGHGYHPQQQSRHAFANSTSYPAQAGYGMYEPYSTAPPPPPYRPQDYQQQQHHAHLHAAQTYSSQQQHERTYSQERMRSQSRGRWSGQAERSQMNESIWRDESREGRISGEYNRRENSVPSSELSRSVFRAPTHERSISRAVEVENQAFVAQPTPQHSVRTSAPVTPTMEQDTSTPVEYDLIPNVSPVPPPPSIEFSGVPFADLATEMVWEACVLAVASGGCFNRWSSTKPPALFNEVADSNRRVRSDSEISVPSVSKRGSSPAATPELFGAIGEGRQTRRSSPDGSSSDSSSPASSAPGTPAGFEALEAAVRTQQKLMGFYSPVGGKSDFEIRGSSSLDSPVEAIRSHVRKMTQLATPPTSPLRPIAAPAMNAEPSPAFRQFVKQVLTATLVSPEDVILALYYIASVPSTSMIPPIASEGSSRASAIKAAPFKLFLGALMLANKVCLVFLWLTLSLANLFWFSQTLQDNSYRNETFAAVSGIPLKDVNDLEVFIFGALGFDVAVRGDIWKTWVGVVVERVRTRRGSLSSDFSNRFEVTAALQKLLQAAQHPTSLKLYNPLEMLPSFDVLIPIAGYKHEEGPVGIEMATGIIEDGPLEPKSLLRYEVRGGRSVRKELEKYSFERSDVKSEIGGVFGMGAGGVDRMRY